MCVLLLYRNLTNQVHIDKKGKMHLSGMLLQIDWDADSLSTSVSPDIKALYKCVIIIIIIFLNPRYQGYYIILYIILLLLLLLKYSRTRLLYVLLKIIVKSSTRNLIKM